MSSPKGSIIKLKPEFEERYIILHKHTFPSVLQQIRKSNIRNYSIFLNNGLLFSYLEYIGNDMKTDMEKMSEDQGTKDWWKLTDPMQEPFPFRAPDEWWAEAKNIFHYENKNPSKELKRISLRTIITDTDNQPELESFFEKLQGWKGKIFSLFQIQNLIILYSEIDSTLNENDLISSLNETGLNWTSSQEVFHTD